MQIRRGAARVRPPWQPMHVCVGAWAAMVGPGWNSELFGSIVRLPGAEHGWHWLCARMSYMEELVAARCACVCGEWTGRCAGEVAAVCCGCHAQGSAVSSCINGMLRNEGCCALRLCFCCSGHGW